MKGASLMVDPVEKAPLNFQPEFRPHFVLEFVHCLDVQLNNPLLRNRQWHQQHQCRLHDRDNKSRDHAMVDKTQEQELSRKSR